MMMMLAFLLGDTQDHGCVAETLTSQIDIRGSIWRRYRCVMQHSDFFLLHAGPSSFHSYFYGGTMFWCIMLRRRIVFFSNTLSVFDNETSAHCKKR